MRKRILAITLVASLLNVVCVAPVAAASREVKEAKRIKIVKTQIARIGTGPKSRIAIRLRDKTELKGYVSETTDDHFVLTDEKTNVATTVDYAQVEKIKLNPFVTSAMRHDFSSGRVFKNAAIGFGLVLTGVLVVCLISKRCED